MTKKIKTCHVSTKGGWSQEVDEDAHRRLVQQQIAAGVQAAELNRLRMQVISLQNELAAVRSKKSNASVAAEVLQVRQDCDEVTRDLKIQLSQLQDRNFLLENEKSEHDQKLASKDAVIATLNADLEKTRQERDKHEAKLDKIYNTARE